MNDEEEVAAPGISKANTNGDTRDINPATRRQGLIFELMASRLFDLNFISSNARGMMMASVIIMNTNKTVGKLEGSPDNEVNFVVGEPLP